VLYDQARHGSTTIRLSHLLGEGRPVVLNFWAGLCPPCRVEMPELERAYGEMGGRVAFIGVDVGPFIGLGTREDGRALVREAAVTFPVGSVDDSSVVVRYRIRGMPTTVFMASDGAVVRTNVGLLTRELLETYVGELLRGAAPR
jgi:thiol-disulfide isomerase/thioredoxin